MPKLDTLEKALVDELKDILSAEKQALKALPKMAKTATDPKLKEAFEEHLEQTKEQVTRLEKAFEAMGQKATAKKCKAMEGIIAEGQELMEEDASDDVKDALLIAGAQKIEHYEIASYGTVCTWSDLLGKSDVSELLKETMGEEEKADKKLTRLSKQINKDALDG